MAFKGDFSEPSRNKKLSGLTSRMTTFFEWHCTTALRISLTIRAASTHDAFHNHLFIEEGTLFRVRAFFDSTPEWSTFAVLHHQMDAFLCLIGAIEVGDVERWSQFCQNVHFVMHVPREGLCHKRPQELLLHRLHCKAKLKIPSPIHMGRSASPLARGSLCGYINRRETAMPQ